MNPLIKKRWIAALRSGVYTQGQNALCTRDADGTRFCCLGVLCDLYMQEHGGDWTPRQPDDGEGLQFEGHWSYLPPSVRDWAGLLVAGPDPEVIYADGESARCLSELNDSKQHSFSDLAWYIDESL